MVHVSIQHIIGTIALIGLALSAALAYQIIIGYIEVNVLQSQMNQTAEYVSMSIANIISLTEFTYGILPVGGTITKRLNLPADLSGKNYIVRLVNESGKYYVYVEISGKSDLYAKSPIPVNSTTTPIIMVTEKMIRDGSIRLLDGRFVNLSDDDVKPQAYIYGGNPNAVVWCEKREDVLYVGLGLRRG